MIDARERDSRRAGGRNSKQGRAAALRRPPRRQLRSSLSGSACGAGTKPKCPARLALTMRCTGTCVPAWSSIPGSGVARRVQPVHQLFIAPSRRRYAVAPCIAPCRGRRPVPPFAAPFRISCAALRSARPLDARQRSPVCRTKPCAGSVRAMYGRRFQLHVDALRAVLEIPAAGVRRARSCG